MDMTNNKKDGVIKAGYKQTEVGVIPEDWVVTSIGNIAKKIIGGGTPSRTNSAYWKGNIPWMTVKDFASFNKTSTQEYITKEGLKCSSSKLIKKGNIITSTRMALGKAVIYDVNVSINQDLKAIFLKYEFDVNYLFYWFQINSELIESLGSGSTVLGLSKTDLENLIINIPPTKAEQTAIAKALSDTDSLIHSLNQLITKKRQIKQGAMQQLLNPYDKGGELKDGWEVKTLGSVLKIGHGKSQHEVISPNGRYPVLASGGEIGRATSFLYDKPSVLIGRKGTIDIPQYMDRPFWTIDTLFYSEILGSNNAKYIFYQFCLIDWYSYNEASGVPSLSAKTIEKIEITIPTPIEQTQIAKTLTNIDTEITNLETKRAKYQQIKQGMMQNLLTGRIRLI